MKKTRTWILSILLAAVMLLGCIPAMAEENPEWKINQHTQLVSRKSAAEKLESIVVPAEVDGIPVLGVEYMAFNMHKNFKQLTIEDSAVMLDRRVLRDLLKLETVDLPENLLIIREGNFTNLPKLTSVVIPASVSLVHNSFNKCESLTSITFEGMCPVFVTVGSFGMFTDLPADCAIYVPDNQVSAYKAAFADREDVVARIQPSGQNAERIDWTAPESDFTFDASTGTITGYTGSASCLMIPASIGGVQVKHLAESAFNTNYGLCYVVIPEGVESVGKYCFSGELLSYVSLPSTLTSVDGAIFGSRMSAISYNAADVPAYEANAFDYIKSDAWQLIMPYGTSQEIVDSFTAYLSSNAPAAVVKASIVEPYSFPALDAEAGAPFMGTWHSVAVFDGTDYYTAELLGMVMDTVLNPDGTGSLIMEGENNPGGWYVKDGAAIFAPIFEEGGLPVEEEAVLFTLDENDRMIIDFGGLFVIFEQDGVVYSTPAIPEKPWPELNYDNMKYFIGKWEAVSYTMDGETYDAAMVGPMILVLNEDGTAQTIEEGEAPYDLLWAADYGTAYVGPTMNTAAEVTFDGTGNIVMEQDGASILMKPYVEPTPEPTPVPTPEPVDTSAILGHWDDGFKTLDIYEDGRIELTYKSDGYVSKMEWAIVDGKPTITEGLWENCPIVIENGLLIISNDTGVYQEYSRDGGEASEEDEDDYADEVAALAVPVGEAGAPFIGTWTPVEMIMDGQSINVALLGMMMEITFNEDGTVSMSEDGEADLGVWTVQDGKAVVDIMVCALNDKGQLVMEDEEVVMILEKGVGGAEVSEEDALLALLAMMGDIAEYELNTGDETAQAESSADPYIGVKFEMTGAIVQGIQLTAQQLGCAGDYVVFNADGSATLVMSGIDVQTLGWKRGKVNVLGVEYEDGFTIDYYGTYYNFAVTEEGLLLDYFGMLRTYERAEGAAAQPAAAAEDPYIGKKFLCTGSIVQGIQLTAAQLGCAGDYVVFNADGSAELVMSGIPVQTLGWKRGKVNVLGVEYEDGFTIDYYGTYYNFAVTEEGLLLDYFGMLRTYEKE